MSVMDEEVSRRGFAGKLVYLLNAVIGAAMAVPAALYLLVPKKAAGAVTWTKVGSIADLPLNAPHEVAYQRIRRDGWKIVQDRATAWVVKSSDNQATALHPRCTHLGCAYHWDDSKNLFACPCHASSFKADGSVIGGPAPRALDRYETKVEGGVLYVSRVIEGKQV
jgi:menaquinol-cytochrome c reductase iron-sulfur subunit